MAIFAGVTPNEGVKSLKRSGLLSQAKIWHIISRNLETVQDRKQVTINHQSCCQTKRHCARQWPRLGYIEIHGRVNREAVPRSLPRCRRHDSGNDRGKKWPWQWQRQCIRECACTFSDALPLSLFICPIAIAYSIGQIIKSVCVCQCVSLSVCPSASTLSLSRSHFLIDFHQNGHRRQYPQKEERVR